MFLRSNLLRKVILFLHGYETFFSRFSLLSIYQNTSESIRPCFRKKSDTSQQPQGVPFLSFKVNREDQLLHSEIAPNFTVGSFWCKVSDFTVKQIRGYRTQAVTSKYQNLKSSTIKCSNSPLLLLTPHVQESVLLCSERISFIISSALS